MLGELYEAALAGAVKAEVEHADGTRMPLAVDQWIDAAPGDLSLVDRCHGPTLDVGSGPGRLTVALSERGVPALGIDVTPYAVKMAQSSGALAMLRDVFGHVPGAGRWMTVLLADGNIGIGGDPAALLQRVSELLAPGGQALVEVQPPGVPLRLERVRLRREGTTGAWFPWAYVGADQIGDIARNGGLVLRETWTANGRWFAALRYEQAAGEGEEGDAGAGVSLDEELVEDPRVNLDAAAVPLPVVIPRQASGISHPDGAGLDRPEPEPRESDGPDPDPGEADGRGLTAVPSRESDLAATAMSADTQPIPVVVPFGPVPVTS